MEGPQAGNEHVVIQRRRPRKDCIKHTLAWQPRAEVPGWRFTIGKIEKARRLESEAAKDSRSQVVSSHRGPGALSGPAPARAAQEEITNLEFARAAQDGMPSNQVPPQGVGPQHRFVSGVGKAQPERGPRTGFPNPLGNLPNTCATGLQTQSGTQEKSVSVV